MVLFYNYYKDKSEVRQLEIDFALRMNLDNELITTLYLLCESLPSFKLPDKVVVIRCPNRLKFKDIIKFANSISTIQIKIFCNSDIYFDDTLDRINHVMGNGVVYCLTRWEFEGNGEHWFYENFQSQDAWIFNDNLPSEIGDYYLGTPGCDNHFAYELTKNNFKIENPSLSIKAIHVHSSNKRNYHKTIDRINGKYVYPIPTALHGLETDWSNKMNAKLRKIYHYRIWKNNLEGVNGSFIQRVMSRVILLFIKS